MITWEEFVSGLILGVIFFIIGVPLWIVIGAIFGLNSGVIIGKDAAKTYSDGLGKLDFAK